MQASRLYEFTEASTIIRSTADELREYQMNCTNYCTGCNKNCMDWEPGICNAIYRSLRRTLVLLQQFWAKIQQQMHKKGGNENAAFNKPIQP